MRAATTTAAATLCLLATLAAGACSAPSSQSPATTAQPAQTEPAALEPTEEPTPDAVISTELGAIVPADQIDAAREAGVAVYVSPTGDGSGIVVDPDATLPEELITEVEAVEGIPTDAAHYGQQLGSLTDILEAHDEAGTKIIAIVAMANVSGTSAQVTGYTAIGSAATGTFDASGGKAEVLAAAQAYAAANPGTTVIDLTD